MKTIVKNGEYLRVKEDEANLKVSKQGYKFVPKSQWKELHRDINKKKKEEK